MLMKISHSRTTDKIELFHSTFYISQEIIRFDFKTIFLCLEFSLQDIVGKRRENCCISVTSVLKFYIARQFSLILHVAQGNKVYVKNKSAKDNSLASEDGASN